MVLPRVVVENKYQKCQVSLNCLLGLFYIWELNKFVADDLYLFSNFVVHGALRCLALLSVDLDDTVVPTLVPALFPCLLKIVSSPEVGFLFIFIFINLFSFSLNCHSFEIFLAPVLHFFSGCFSKERALKFLCRMSVM